ncbi:MAG: glucose-1-phosphate thymidylyltransferase [Candidatus Dormibacteria bacterium]
MKGLILSGGKGSRLRPITHTSAKQLVPVANRPILFYAVDTLVSAGVTDIGVVVGDTAAEVEAALREGAFGAAFTFIPQEAPLGLAHAVMISRHFLGDDPFVMYLGDNLIADGIQALVRDFEQSRPDALIMLARVHEPNRFGVAAFEQGRLVRLVEKPSEPPSDLALVGVYMFNARVHDAVAAIRPSPRGELEITDAIQWLIDHGHRVEHHEIAGFWKDTGRLEDLLEANRITLEALSARSEGTVDPTSQVSGKVVLEEGAQVLNHSVVRGPAIIGRGTVLDHAYVGPYTSIHFGCRITQSEIEHSIVLENTTVEGITDKIEGSLIGKEVRVARGVRRPVAIRLMLGDHSEVELA